MLLKDLFDESRCVGFCLCWLTLSSIKLKNDKTWLLQCEHRKISKKYLVTFQHDIVKCWIKKRLTISFLKINFCLSTIFYHNSQYKYWCFEYLQTGNIQEMQCWWISVKNWLLDDFTYWEAHSLTEAKLHQRFVRVATLTL